MYFSLEIRFTPRFAKIHPYFCVSGNSFCVPVKDPYVNVPRSPIPSPSMDIWILQITATVSRAAVTGPVCASLTRAKAFPWGMYSGVKLLGHR